MLGPTGYYFVHQLVPSLFLGTSIGSINFHSEIMRMQKAKGVCNYFLKQACTSSYQINNLLSTIGYQTGTEQGHITMVI